MPAVHCAKNCKIMYTHFWITDIKVVRVKQHGNKIQS